MGGSVCRAPFPPSLDEEAAPEQARFRGQRRWERWSEPGTPGLCGGRGAASGAGVERLGETVSARAAALISSGEEQRERHPHPRLGGPGAQRVQLTALPGQPEQRAPRVGRVGGALQGAAIHEPLQDPREGPGVEVQRGGQLPGRDAGRRPTIRTTRRCGPVMPSARSMRLEMLVSPWSTAHSSA